MKVLNASVLCIAFIVVPVIKASDHKRTVIGITAVCYDPKDVCKVLQEPCENGGTCSPTDDDEQYKCTCPKDFGGKHCQEKLMKPTVENTVQNTVKPTPCSPNPCKNGGRCLTFARDNFQCICRRGFGLADCSQCLQPLGMENGRITNSQITASSMWDADHGPSNARLNFKAGQGKSGSWTAKTTDVNQWLKVDLGMKTKVTAIETQGRQECCNQWVTQYTISYSLDDSTYKQYQIDGRTEVFRGNNDHNTIVREVLFLPIMARYIRIHPTSWNNYISMRVEFLGCIQECFQPLGMESGRISNDQITASSMWDADHGPSNARLNFKAGQGKSGSWSAKTNDVNQWLKVDLGMKTKVTAIEIQGRQECCDQWVTQYTMSYSLDDSTYKQYQIDGQTEVFQGNNDRNTIVREVLFLPIMARYIRIHPISWNNHISMRAEFLGCIQG